ncbi:Mu-like prophage major head subunit gpT family protein [Reyranella sp.]|uniref:Mu-like prophage major head subunit gpT family protein n=1 Tax=Reyranella sp. TaxID=1929291 RepID=UPI003C7B5EB6
MSTNLLQTGRAVNAALYTALTMGPAAWADRYAMTIQSNQASELYAWLGNVPVMREWIGGRQAKQLREYSWRVDNKDYEATLEVHLNELRRGSSGDAIRLKIAQLAQRVQSFPSKQLTQLLIDGESTACYDGQYFFDTDHAEGDSGAQSNDLTYAAATGTTPTIAEFRDAVMQSITTIMSYKDDQGEPANEDANAFEIMVPPTLMATAISAIRLPTLDAGATNIIPALSEFSIVPVVNARLTAANKFYTVRTDGPMKPFIKQVEQELQVASIAEGSELEFNEKKHRHGVEWMGAFAFGFWNKAVLTTFT